MAWTGRRAAGLRISFAKHSNRFLGVIKNRNSFAGAQERLGINRRIPAFRRFRRFNFFNQRSSFNNNFLGWSSITWVEGDYTLFLGKNVEL